MTDTFLVQSSVRYLATIIVELQCMASLFAIYFGLFDTVFSNLQQSDGDNCNSREQPNYWSHCLIIITACCSWYWGVCKSLFGDPWYLLRGWTYKEGVGGIWVAFD